MNTKLSVPSLVLTASLASSLLLTGCGLGGSLAPASKSPGLTVAAHKISGAVHGGQQPVANSVIQLYAAGSAVGAPGYGSAASPLIGSTILTDAGGNFDITGTYTCPSPGTQVYLTATGGNPIPGQNPNSGLALMAALGPCSSLASINFIIMNEVTTVAAAYALAPFSTGPANIGTSTTNPTGLVNAFTTANKIGNYSTGIVGGPYAPANTLLPAAEIYTIANILAACVNTSGGYAGDGGSPCGQLYTYTTPPSGPYAGVAPTDTFTAAINMAKYPAQNVGSLFYLNSTVAPFQPSLNSAPNDWTVGIRYAPAGVFSAPAGIAADASGNLWVANTGTAKSLAFIPPGGELSTFAAGLTGTSGAVATDLNGNAWTASATSGVLLKVTPTGTVSTATGGGLATTAALAVDGSGNIWAAESNNTLAAFTASGTALSPAGGYTGAGVATPSSLAITPK